MNIRVSELNLTALSHRLFKVIASSQDYCVEKKGLLANLPLGEG